MKYKPITELTDREVAEMVTTAINDVTAVRNIKRDEKDKKITLEIHFDGFDGKPIFDEIEINMNFYCGNLWADGHAIEGEELLRIQQYLIAKGCHPLFKDNPYLK